MNKVNLKIITPEKVAYESFVDRLSVSTEAGRIGILPKHIPLVSILKPGELLVTKDAIELPMAVSTGIVEIKPFYHEQGNTITPVVVLADHLELAHEINLEKSQQAYERAKKAMEEKEHLQDADFANLQSLIQREVNRIKIGNKYKK